MRRSDAAAWVISVYACSLRSFQSTTLGVLVAAVVGVRRATLANLGRLMLGGAKHQVKRAWQFTNNGRDEVSDAIRPVVGRRPERRDECWFPMTDQPGTARQLCQLYGRRMTIEQLFRDDPFGSAQGANATGGRCGTRGSPRPSGSTDSCWSWPSPTCSCAASA